MSAVPAGYKQTDVGVIPNTWAVDRLDKFWSVTDCKHVTAKFIANGYPLASIKEVQSRFVELADAKQTTQQFYNQLTEGGRKPRVGDLIISRNATVGEVAQVADWHPPFAMGQDVCLMRKCDQEYSTDFLQAVFRSPVIARQLSDLMVGSTFKRINVQQIKSFSVPMPPPSEQRAIATALSDVDALLAKLDQFIAKKRDLKQAAMQQLLTGQTRLPGFCGEWEVKRLRNVADLSPGINKPVSEMGTGVLYVTVQDLYKGTSIPVENLGRIRISAVELQGQALVAGDIIFGKSSVKREGIGYPSIFLGAAEPAVCTGFAYRARANPEYADAKYLFYALRWEPTRKWVIENSQASALTNINKTIADAIPVPLPPLKEQTAIATVLSDMDAEIAALEARRDKTRALKQGMMQELLTGRIRLV